MILKEILNIIKSNSELIEILKPTESDPKIYAYTGSYKESCIIYSFTNLTSDGVIKTSSLEIDSYNNNYETSYKMAQIIQNLLITIGDNTLNDNVLKVSLNGGGHLYHDDIKSHMVKSIFSIQEKVRDL